jgi:hypothetical protein
MIVVMLLRNGILVVVLVNLMVDFYVMYMCLFYLFYFLVYICDTMGSIIRLFINKTSCNVKHRTALKTLIAKITRTYPHKVIENQDPYFSSKISKHDQNKKIAIRCHSLIRHHKKIKQECNRAVGTI